jgi:hypothetical protein
MDDLYTFVYRGQMTDASLDKAGRRRKIHFGAEDAARIREAMSYEMLDSDMLVEAQRMSLVYTAIHAFENSVRQLVQKTLMDTHEEKWWDEVPERIKKKVKTRQDEDAKFRWHGTRGGSDITYCDFGDLSSIIVTNWSLFEDILANMEWAKALLSTLEKSRNIVMHGGALAQEDIERIGMNIRDWIRQTG